MATREKKIKSSKQDEKKHGKKVEDITIVVDDIKDSESLASPIKGDACEPPETSDQNEYVDPNTTDVNHSAEDTDVPPSDATKLTAIIIERYEGNLVRGQYEGYGECWLDGGSMYKGDFSQGMMHGQGIFTWKNGQIYEGEFHHNAITGKGVYTWPDGSSYNGDLLNGLRHGVGTFVEKDGKMTYTGEWQYGKRHGKGRLDYECEKISYYDGDWVQNIRHGHGTRQYASGNVYTGMWFNNLRHGKGTMKWVDSNQMYIGQWEDGVQHGSGQHVWFMRRIAGSQYALRNTYDGEFVKGIRHGYGTIYYANGAKYEGYWNSNMKHGKGRFTFKNGRYYEGKFEQDHIKEHPEFSMNGDESPDMQGIRTRTPLPMENMSVHSNMSTNTIGPSFQLDLDSFLNKFNFTVSEDDVRQVNNAIRRHMSALKKTYDFYSSLGYYDSSDNTFILSHMQFWRLLKDCQLHHRHLSLIDMDRLLEFENQDQQNPHDTILFRQFVNHLIHLSVHLFHEEFMNEAGELSVNACVNKLINDHILQHGCKVKGYFYHETRRAHHALPHVDNAYQIYRAACKPHKKNPRLSSMKMRDFLFLIRDLNLVNKDLDTRSIVQILTNDNPNATDEQEGYNLEMEITFLEFFEALVGCAQLYVTECVAKDPTTPGGESTACPTAMGGGDQLSLASEPTSARSAVPPEQDDDYDGKSSLAPLMSPRSATPGNAPQLPERAVSSVVAGSTSKPKTECSESVDALRNVDISGRGGLVVSPLKDSQAGVSGATIVEGQKSEMDEEEAPSEIAKEQTDVPFEVSEDSAETRQFNFWTHQVYIFFVVKFFPAFHKYALLRNLSYDEKCVQQKCCLHSPNCICRGAIPSPPPTPEPPVILPSASSPETRLSSAVVNEQ